MNEAKAKFKAICERTHNLPCFMTFQWYHTLCHPSEWGVAIVENDGDLVGLLPYFIQRKRGFTFIRPLPLTPYIGPYIVYPPNQKPASKSAFEQKIIRTLLSQLPSFDQYNVSAHPSLTNGLPMKWEGYEVHTRYAYFVALQTTNLLLENFSSDFRRSIKKAEKAQVYCKPTDDIEACIAIKQAAYKANNQKLPMSNEFLQKAFELLTSKGECLLMGAFINQNLVGFLWSCHTSNEGYGLFAATLPAFKNIGIANILYCASMKHLMNKVTTYDMGGCNLEQLERSKRGGGGVLTPYLEFQKTPSKLLQLKNVFLP